MINDIYTLNDFMFKFQNQNYFRRIEMLLKLDIVYGKETLSVDFRVGKGDQTVK